MADETKPNVAPAGAPPAQDKGAAPAPERPSWLPESYKTPEEFRAAYDATQSEASKYKQAAERWSKWGDPDEFEKNLATRVAERDKTIEKQLRQQWDRERGSQQQQQDPFDNWETLSPREQATKLTQMLKGELVNELDQRVSAKWNEAGARLGDFDNRFALLTRALTERVNHPDLDLNALWKEANALSTGDHNKLFDMAVQNILQPKMVEKKIADAIAAERVKLNQEFEAKQKAALVGSGYGQTRQSFKDTINARHGDDHGTDKASRRMRILEAALADGSITPGQV